jgi:membrane protein YdbS with pleckstrin-like domain
MHPSESGLRPPIPAHIAAIQRPIDKLMTYYVIRAALTLVAFPVVLVILYFRYHTMRYKFDAEGIHMSWGILMHHEIMLNYSRIQDIHLRSNVVERWLGLARIVVQTAAGSSGSEMTLEGLTDHVAMRDFLYERMRGARHLQSSNDSPAAEQDELAQTLTLIAKELRAIRALIAEKPPLA